MEAVNRHNVTPKDDTTASTVPANLIPTYCTRVKSIDNAPPLDAADSATYTAGDIFWVKKQCKIQFKKGKVTKDYNLQFNSC